MDTAVPPLTLQSCQCGPQARSPWKPSESVLSKRKGPLSPTTSRSRSRTAPSRSLVQRGLFTLLYLGCLLSMPGPAAAVLASARVSLSDGQYVYAAPAYFGWPLPDEKDATFVPIRVPSSAANGCGPVEVDAPSTEGFVLLVERGGCLFEAKALAAQEAGASGLIVMNSLEGIYQGKSAAQDETDYECRNGQGWVKDLESPVWSPENTDEACWSNSACDSGVCLVTNMTDSSLGNKVCCAWDLYINMQRSENEVVDEITIPAVYVTIADGQKLWNAGEVDVEIFRRSRSIVSSFLLWGLGVATAMWAAIRSGDDIKRRRKLGSEGDDGAAGIVNEMASMREEPPSLELGVRHTLAFVVFASGMLMLLFFFNLGIMVNLLFCISATTATATVILLPLMRRARHVLVDLGIFWNDGDGGVIDCGCFGLLSGFEVSSTLTAMGLAIWWFAVRHTASYAWVLQDIFGCCLSATFLATIRLPSIKVATFLLLLAFVYDIFWVFLSAPLFGQSVMVKVATGGEITKDPVYCDKYPTDSGCQVNSLPMLLLLPKIWDYTGGFAMLGLGDIVIPGLLLSFAHRFDVSVGMPFKRGYFIFMAAGYSVGLLMANMAATVMGLAQPALLYLVPCTLGPFVSIAYYDGTLRSMWEGPPSLTAQYTGYDGLLSDAGSPKAGGGKRLSDGGVSMAGHGGSSPLGASGSGRRSSGGGSGSGEWRTWGDQNTSSPGRQSSWWNKGAV